MPQANFVHGKRSWAVPSHPGTASKMFEALFENDINIDMISTSEIKISVLIDAQDADRAVAAVHKAFYPELN